MTDPGSLRVVTAMAPALLRDGLAHMLRAIPEVDHVETAASAVDLRRLVEARRPDVVLADDRVLAEAGLPHVSDDRGPAVLAVVLQDRAAEPGPGRVWTLLRAGVRGVLSDADGAEALAEAVQVLAQGGEIYLSPRIAERLAPSDRPIDEGEAVGLTPREREVVGRAALGHSNARIAADLGLAAGTVRNYLSAVYAALGVATRAEAVAWAWRHGLAGDGRSGAQRVGDPRKNATHDI